MNEFLANLRREATDNPTMAIAVATGFLAAAGKFVEAVAHHKGANAFAKDATRRARLAKK